MSGWIQTYTGRAFTPLEPRSEDVSIEDIAHALSMKCRFTGHCQVFYSVAEHCVRMSKMPVTQEHALWLLLHDAGEAYLPDVARPIKSSLEGFDKIERRVLNCIYERFGLDPDDEPIALIKRSDLLMLAQEQRDLMFQPPPRVWESIVGTHPDDAPICPWTTDLAKMRFLSRFYELCPAIQFGT